MGRRGKRRNLARTGGVLAVALSAVLLAGPAEASHLFEPAERFRVATWLGSAAIGDVTADGRNDVLVTGSAGDNRLFVFPQSAEGPLEPARIYHFDGHRGSDWTGVDAGDLNGDGATDVAVAAWTGVDLLYGTAGSLSGPTKLPEVLGAQHVLLRDMNLDGRVDLVIGSMNGFEEGAGVFLTTNHGSTFSTQRINPRMQRDIEVGDVNGDGRPDVVGLAHPNGPAYTTAWLVDVCLQQSNGGFACTLHDPQTSWGLQGVEVADVTGDGRHDISVTMSANWPTGRVIVYPQTANGDLGSPVRYPVRDVAHPIEAADVNGDGRQDLVVGHNAWPWMGVLMQRADGSLEEEELYDSRGGNYNPAGLATGDITGDRRPDVVLADSGGYVEVFRHVNEGPVPLSPPPSPPPSTPPPPPAPPPAPSPSPSESGSDSATQPSSAVSRGPTSPPTSAGRPLVVKNFVARPTVPKAGRPFELRMRVGVRNAPTAALRTSCSARVAGRTLRAVKRSQSTGATCRWTVPKGLRGKLLRASITVRWKSATATRRYERKLR